MRYSAAMLAGYKKVDGRQCKNIVFRTATGKGTHKPEEAHSACVTGAVILGGERNLAYDAHQDFVDAWGLSPVGLNNEGLPWQEIYGMAAAAGL